MSDDENEDGTQNTDILGPEGEAEFDSGDNYIVKDMKNNIIEKNGLLYIIYFFI